MAATGGTTSKPLGEPLAPAMKKSGHKCRGTSSQTHIWDLAKDIIIVCCIKLAIYGVQYYT